VAGLTPLFRSAMFRDRRETIMGKLTGQFIRSMQVQKRAKDVQAFADGCPGFGVRKQSNRHATFFRQVQHRQTAAP
jgi:hypothetical protein